MLPSKGGYMEWISLSVAVVVILAWLGLVLPFLLRIIHIKSQRVLLSEKEKQLAVFAVLSMLPLVFLLLLIFLRFR